MTDRSAAFLFLLIRILFTGIVVGGVAVFVLFLLMGGELVLAFQLQLELGEEKVAGTNGTVGRKR
jgi:hypothetical protein